MRNLNGIKVISIFVLMAVTFSLSVLLIKVSEKNSSVDEEVDVEEGVVSALDCYVCEKLSWNQDFTEVEIEKSGEIKILNMKEEIEKRKRIEAEKIAEERRLARLEDERIKEEERQAEIAEQKRQEEMTIRLAEEKKKRDAERAEQKRTEVVSRGSGYQSNYELTHYTAFCPTGCTGKTASGHVVSNTIYYQGLRIVAAPKNISFYTKLRITYGDGTKIDAIVLDRGGDIVSGRLDLLVSNRDEAYRLGRQQVKVEILR